MCAQPSNGCVALYRADIAAEAVGLMNARRRNNNLAELDTPAALSAVAIAYAGDTLCGNPTGNIAERLQALGYNEWEEFGGDPMGGGGPMSGDDSTAGLEVWIAGESISQKLLNSSYTSVGVGCVEQPGTKSYWAWIFTERAVSG